MNSTRISFRPDGSEGSVALRWSSETFAEGVRLQLKFWGNAWIALGISVDGHMHACTSEATNIKESQFACEAWLRLQEHVAGMEAQIVALSIHLA